MGDERLQYLRETGQTALAKEYEQYLRETGQLERTPPKGVKSPEEIAKLNAADKEQSGLEAVGAGTETALDSATLGLSGLASDAIGALGGETFQGMRQARKARKEQFRKENPATALGLEIGGAILPSVVPGVGAINLARSAGTVAAKALPKVAGAAGARRVAGNVARSNVADAVAQGAIAGGVGELGDGQDDSFAGGAAKGAAGGVLGAALGRLAGSGVRAVQRTRDAGRLDKEALNLVKRMKGDDAVNYGRARAAAQDSPAISDILNNDPILAPIAKELREEAAYKGVPLRDTDAAMEVYKRLSETQRQAQRTIDAATEFRPELRSKVEMMGSAKDKLLTAVEQPTDIVIPGRARTVEPPQVVESSKPLSLRDAIDRFKSEAAEGQWRRADIRGKRPGETVAQSQAREALDRRIVEGRAPQTTGQPTAKRVVERESRTETIPAGNPLLRGAIGTHRENASLLDALIRGADVGENVGWARRIAGKKLNKQSESAFLDEIQKMTPEQAKMAYTGLLGRGREALKLSANPITAFNIIPSVVRAPLYAARNRNIVRALEKKMGRGALGKATEMVGGKTLARTFGAEAGR